MSMTMKLLVVNVGIFLLIFISGCTGLPPRPRGNGTSGLIFLGDFENGILADFGIGAWGKETARPDSAQIVTSPVRKGHYAVKFTLRPDDIAAKKNRAELTIKDKFIENFPPSSEAWYSWSFLVPEDYTDAPSDKFQIMGQWHHRPPPGETFEYFERVYGRGGGPPISINYGKKGNQTGIALTYGATSPLVSGRTVAIHQIEKGQWIDLVFHIRWSTGNDGFIEAWFNGEPWTQGKVYGPNMYNEVPNFLKIGLYREFGIETTNSVYFDEVKIGESF